MVSHGGAVALTGCQAKEAENKISVESAVPNRRQSQSRLKRGTGNRSACAETDLADPDEQSQERKDGMIRSYLTGKWCRYPRETGVRWQS